MGRALYETVPAARRVFDEADAALGFAFSRICVEGPDSELNRTAAAQPALLITSLAHLAALREQDGALPAPQFVAGHSLGEYSALVAAGALPLDQAVRRVRARGEAMQAAGDTAPDGSSMAAVIGADPALLAEVCAANEVDMANFNAPDQTVISGSRSGVAAAVATLKERGVRRIVPLAVSIAAHSRLMRHAADDLAGLLEAADLRAPQVPLIANVSAQAVSDPATIRALLMEQLYSPVRWFESVQFMAGAGVTTFWEIGAGKVLGGLIKRTLPDAGIEHSEIHLAAPSNV
jgi:[acyl-carrier-protein] S-malonyltransferase